MKVICFLLVLFYFGYGNTLSPEEDLTLKHGIKLYNASVHCIQIYSNIEINHVISAYVLEVENPSRDIQCFCACIAAEYMLFENGKISDYALREIGTDFMAIGDTITFRYLQNNLNILSSWGEECQTNIDEYADECEMAHQFGLCLYKKVKETDFFKGSVQKLNQILNNSKQN